MTNEPPEPWPQPPDFHCHQCGRRLVYSADTIVLHYAISPTGCWCWDCATRWEREAAEVKAGRAHWEVLDDT